MTKGRTVNMEVKKALCDTTIVPTLMYTSETWPWNEAEISKIQVVEMSDLRSACDLNWMDGWGNETYLYRQYKSGM